MNEYRLMKSRLEQTQRQNTMHCLYHASFLSQNPRKIHTIARPLGRHCSEIYKNIMLYYIAL